MKQGYFYIYEISFLSLMAALVYVLKIYFKTPMHLPGHTAIVWVIPFIIGIGLTKKFGAGAYIGLISGLLIGTIGAADKGILEVFEWSAMGITMDFLALAFRGHLTNPLVGVILGGFGSFDKTLVNWYISSMIFQNTNLLIAGIGVAGTVSLVMGGAGGAIAAIIVNRVQHIHFPDHNNRTMQPKVNPTT